MTHTVWVNALVSSTWPLLFCQGLKMHDLLSDIGDWLAGAGNAVTNTDWVVTSLTSSLDKTLIITARHVSFLKYEPLPSKVGLLSHLHQEWPHLSNPNLYNTPLSFSTTFTILLNGLQRWSKVGQFGRKMSQRKIISQKVFTVWWASCSWC